MTTDDKQDYYVKASKDAWLNLLHAERVRVTFNRVSDGAERIMDCTLVPKYLPMQTHIKEVVHRENPEVVAVWDINKEAWRSFRMDTVTAIEVL